MGGNDEESGIVLTNLKSMNDLDSSVWKKISEILCNVEIIQIIFNSIYKRIFIIKNR